MTAPTFMPQITYIPLHYTQTKATWNSDSPLLEKIVRVTSALFSETFVNLWNALQNLVTWCQHTMTSAPTQPVDPKTELLSLLAADRLDVARIHTLMNPGESLAAIPEIAASLPTEEELQQKLAQALQSWRRMRSLYKLIQGIAQIIRQDSQERPISQALATAEFGRISKLFIGSIDSEDDELMQAQSGDYSQLFIDSIANAINSLPVDASRQTYSISDTQVNELLHTCRNEEPEYIQKVKESFTLTIRINRLNHHYENNASLFAEIEKEQNDFLKRQLVRQ